MELLAIVADGDHWLLEQPLWLHDRLNSPSTGHSPQPSEQYESIIGGAKDFRKLTDAVFNVLEEAMVPVPQLREGHSKIKIKALRDKQVICSSTFQFDCWQRMGTTLFVSKAIISFVCKKVKSLSMTISTSILQTLVLRQCLLNKKLKVIMTKGIPTDSRPISRSGSAEDQVICLETAFCDCLCVLDF